MSTTQLKKLIDNQNEIWQGMCGIRDAAAAQERGLTAEERTNWDKWEAELEQVSGDIERLQRAQKLDEIDFRTVAGATGAGEQNPEDDEAQRAKAYEAAFFAFARGGMEELDTDQRQVLRSGFLSAKEARAQGVGTGAAGGYLVPDGFRAVMTETMKAFGGLLNIANVITTSTGNPLPWPTNDDTNNEGAILGENTQIGEQDIELGQQEINAYTYTSKLVRVAWVLLEDSAFDLENWLPKKLGERIGRASAGHFAAGTGTGQPEGILSNATVGVTGAASATATITYDNLVDLEHSVDPAYRNAGNCRYLMSDAALKMLRKMKDNDERPLWQPIPAPGFPPTINGWSYTIDQKITAPAADAKSIAFGDFRAGYIIRQVRDVRMVRLLERYADFLQTGFFGFARMDAKPDDPAAIAVYQHGAAA